MQYLEKLGPFYFGIGGIGDALLTLASFIPSGENTNSIVYWANNGRVLREFFRTFQDIGVLGPAVVFQGWQPKEQFNELIAHQNFRGKAHIPDRLDYISEWTNNSTPYLSTIQKDKFGSLVKGSFHYDSPQKPLIGLGVWGSRTDPWKKKHLTQQEFELLLGLIIETGKYDIAIFGSEDDRQYIVPPLPAHTCIEDLRGESFQTIFQKLNQCDRFIGTDTWFKTYAGLIHCPTVVIRSEYSVPLRTVFNQDRDPADNIFLDPDFWGFDFICMKELPQIIHKI